jgi:hypothetical protein
MVHSSLFILLIQLILIQSKNFDDYYSDQTQLEILDRSKLLSNFKTLSKRTTAPWRGRYRSRYSSPDDYLLSPFTLKPYIPSPWKDYYNCPRDSGNVSYVDSITFKLVFDLYWQYCLLSSSICFFDRVNLFLLMF